MENNLPLLIKKAMHQWAPTETLFQNIASWLFFLPSREFPFKQTDGRSCPDISTSDSRRRKKVTLERTLSENFRLSENPFPHFLSFGITGITLRQIKLRILRMKYQENHTE
jgi:hypothetical protein